MKKNFSKTFLAKTLTGFLVLLIAATAFAGAMEVTSTSTDPNPAIPGKSITLWANLTNKSVDSAADAVVKLKLKSDTAETTYPFALEEGDIGLRELGTINPYKTATVNYRILVAADAPDGTYTIYIETGDEGKTRMSAPVSIKILSRRPDIKIVSSIPESTTIGSPVELEMVLKNTGSSTAYNISVGPAEDRSVTSTGIVVERSVVPLGTAFSYLESISANETATVTMKIIINPGSDPKAYYIPMRIVFSDENKTQYTNTDYIGLKVQDEADLGVIVSEESILPYPGAKTEITIDIYNAGQGAAEVLRVNADADFGTIKKKDFFIGSLESNDFDSITLETEISKETEPGMHNLTLQISYKDKFGEEHTLTKIVSIKIYSIEEAAADGNAGFPILPVAIVIVIICVGIWVYRRGRKKPGQRQ